MAKNIDEVLWAKNILATDLDPDYPKPGIVAVKIDSIKQSLYSDILELIERCFENNDGYIDDKLRQALKEYFNL